MEVAEVVTSQVKAKVTEAEATADCGGSGFASFSVLRYLSLTKFAVAATTSSHAKAD